MQIIKFGGELPAVVFGVEDGHRLVRSAGKILRAGHMAVTGEIMDVNAGTFRGRRVSDFRAMGLDVIEYIRIDSARGIVALRRKIGSGFRERAPGKN